MTRLMLSIISLVATFVLPFVLAYDHYDHLENHIETNQFRRPSFGRRMLLKNCLDCPKHECQVMGMQRFSEPRCGAFGGLGSPCRMWQEPENKTLHFPHEVLICKNVYMQFCPCGPGLVCEEAECRAERRPIRLQQSGGNSKSELESAWQVFDDYPM